MLVRADEGVEAPSSVIEITHDLGRPRADLWKVAVGETPWPSPAGRLSLPTRTTTEAMVIPENVDAIRAMTVTEPDEAKSIALTHERLGIRKSSSNAVVGSRPPAEGGTL